MRFHGLGFSILMRSHRLVIGVGIFLHLCVTVIVCNQFNGVLRNTGLMIDASRVLGFIRIVYDNIIFYYLDIYVLPCCTNSLSQVDDILHIYVQTTCHEWMTFWTSMPSLVCLS